MDSVERAAVFDLRANDPDGSLADRAGLSDADIDQISELMTAMGRLRDVERRMAEASQRYMRLNETDMRAIHFLITTQNQGLEATAGMLARHLGITTASTTKMLDRLERAGHLTRQPHPRDRRSLVVRISPETAAVARRTVGRQQASRVAPAARLSRDERAVVISFLTGTADALEAALNDPGPAPVESGTDSGDPGPERGPR
jgi:DNA-binding MarR family transcriptional regulator